MGTVYRKSFTKPLPADAEIVTRKGERIARWRDAKGKTRTAPLTDAGDRIRIESATYTAKYRNGDNHVVEVPTGCRTEDAARQVLADLQRHAERVRSGLLTASESRTAEHLATPIGEHVDDYLTHLDANGVSAKHHSETRRRLNRILDDCHFATLAAIDRGTVERWLAEQSRRGMSARTRNTHLLSLNAFCNWSVETGRLISNPVAMVARADEKVDRRRQRRAMSADELARLLDVARRRPLLDAMTVRRGERKGQAVANLTPETRERLDALGRERALMYKTLVLTGLRKGELASLTAGQLYLDGPTPHVELDAADEKSREGNVVAIRADLADDLRAWLAAKLAARQDAARLRLPMSIPSRLPVDTPLFTVPDGLVRILNRDLRLAGIPKRDDRGRTLDVHALRHTFGTLLSRGGVAPRTAQAAMRHSDIDLTMNVYTDPRLLDVHGALDALPTLPLAEGPETGRESLRATGTADGPLAPPLAPTAGNREHTGAFPVTPIDTPTISMELMASDANRGFPREIAGFSGVDTNQTGMGDAGVEPAASSVSCWRSGRLS
jgi:integrase